MMNAVASALRKAASRRDRLALLGRLQDAEDIHDQARRRNLTGVTAEALEADKAYWSGIGGAIATLARTISHACAASAFCETRPKLGDLASRLSESIDDQLDPEAWRVIDAAARLAIGE